LDRLNEAYPLFQNNSIILLDTLDLLVGVDNARLGAIINGIRAAGHFIITTCRRQEIRGIPLKCDIEFELGLYTDDEALEAIHNYIRTFYPLMSKHKRQVQFDNIWNILDAQRKIQELDLDPLILSMIFQTYIPDNIPQEINTQKIYSQFWQVRVLDDRNPSEDEKRIRINLCLLLARSIAFSHEGADSFDIDELAEIWSKTKTSPFPQSVLEKLVSSGILHWARGRTHIRFFHQTFLEYTAAMDIRNANDSQREILLSELYSELKNNIQRRNPILKQVVVQDFFDEGLLYWPMFLSLEDIHTLHSLQITLEVFGKINNSDKRTQQVCYSWIKENPSQVATTVIETIKHFPRTKIPAALALLEPCLQTHEEISIYCVCGDKLALMDPGSVYDFLRARIQLLKKNSKDQNLSEKLTRIRDALVKVFACGVSDALWDLYDFYPSLSTGQQAGLFLALSQAITDDNCHEIVSFCDKRIESVMRSHVSEVRLSFIELLEKLGKYCDKQIKEICQRIYNSNQWKQDHKAAQFTGTLVGKFLLDQEMVSYFTSKIDSLDPHLRLTSTWAIQEAGPQFHDEIINNFIHMARPDLNENSSQMLFKVVSKLHNISPVILNNFLNVCPWPSDVVLPDEFKMIWTFIADQDENKLKKWLWSEIANAIGNRHRQIYIGLLVLISKNVSLFEEEELLLIYKMARSDDVITLKFCDIAGLLVYVDNKLANDLIYELLKSQKQDVRTSTVRSLALSINDHLDFTLSFGDSVLILSGKRDHYGLLHCYLSMLQAYTGSDGIRILKKFDIWFSAQYLDSFQDETAMVGLLTLLKIYGMEHPKIVFQIAKRCPIISQGVAGALSAVYANVIITLHDSSILQSILHSLFELAKTQQGRGQRRIRNSLRMSFPYLVRRLGSQSVFEVFFEKYKEITSPHALEDLVRSIVAVPEWSDLERNRLLNDTDLPPQVKSAALS